MNSTLVLVGLQFGMIGLAVTILVLIPATAVTIFVVTAVRRIWRKT